MGSDTYEQRVVAFIDILGFEKLVNEGRVSTILDAMAIIERRIRELKDVSEAKVEISQFSDSVIVSALDDETGLPYLIHFISLLASELFLNGIWCRGGITSGQMYHCGSVAFGPALIDAYKIESQLAIYPRVLVTWSTAERFADFKNHDLPKSRVLGLGAFFRQDFDNNLHLDIFSPKMSLPPSTGTIAETTVAVVNRHVIEQISASEEIGIMKIQSKLFWISEYLHYVEQVHGAWHVTIHKNPEPHDGAA